MKKEKEEGRENPGPVKLVQNGYKFQTNLAFLSKTLSSHLFRQVMENFQDLGHKIEALYVCKTQNQNILE